MSLVVALTKSKEAVIGGDRRSITFLGSWPELEEELYCGRISDDEALLAKAMEMGATLQVTDGRDITGKEVRIRDRGAMGCIIYGNRFTQQIAVSIVVQANGRVDEALIRKIFQEAAERTASISQEHVILKSEKMFSNPQKALDKALEEDCQENGWKLCDPL